MSDMENHEAKVNLPMSIKRMFAACSQEEMKEEASEARKAAAIDALFDSAKEYEPELIPDSREFFEKLGLSFASEEEIARQKAKDKAKKKMKKEPILHFEDQVPGTPWTKKTTGGSENSFRKPVNMKPGQGKKFDQRSEENVEREQKQDGQLMPLLYETPASIEAQGPRDSGSMRRQQAKQRVKNMVKTTASWGLMQAAINDQQRLALSARTLMQRQTSLLPLTNQKKDTSGSCTSDIRYCRRSESAGRGLNEQVDGPSAGTSRNLNKPKVKKANGDEKPPAETNQKDDKPESVTRTPDLQTDQQVQNYTERNEDAAGPSASASRNSEEPMVAASNSDNEGPSWSSTMKALKKKLPQQAGSSDPEVLGYLPKVPNLTWEKIKK